MHISPSSIIRIRYWCIPQLLPCSVLILLIQDLAAGVELLDSDPTLATHISFEGAWVDADGRVMMTNSSYMLDPEGSTSMVPSPLAELLSLKSKHRNLKVLLSIGDPGREDGHNFSTVLGGDAARRVIFAATAANITRDYGFDGVEFRWQNITQGGYGHLRVMSSC